jgi:carboxylate-amine ligase
MVQDGTGADRQRAALAEGGLAAATDLILAQSTMP